MEVPELHKIVPARHGNVENSSTKSKMQEEQGTTRRSRDKHMKRTSLRRTKQGHNEDNSWFLACLVDVLVVLLAILSSYMLLIFAPCTSSSPPNLFCCITNFLMLL